MTTTLPKLLVLQKNIIRENQNKLLGQNDENYLQKY